MMLPYGLILSLISAFVRLASRVLGLVFFWYPQYSSVTNMLLELGRPSFKTPIHNAKVCFANSLSVCDI